MGEKPVLYFDTIILGAGPAGLSAAIYTTRGNLKTAIIDVNMFGGKPAEYLHIENYPGFASISACELTQKFEEHADKFGAEKFPCCEILSVDLTSEIKEIETSENVFKSPTVIIATGSKPRNLNIPGEKEFKCRGVSYCAVCDGAFFKDKTLSVIGGGNSAVEEAIYLTKFAKKVYIVHRRDEFRADNIILERAKENDKIEFITNSVPVEINGSDKVESIILKNVISSEKTKLDVDGVFPYTGNEPNVEFFTGQMKQTTQGYIETDNTMQTSLNGVFAAGDVRNTPLRQVITAASDGALAGYSAVKYLEKFKKTQSINT